MSKKKQTKCIFCGEQPKKQNKEHIIPRWLLQLTGDENRLAYFGMKKEDDELRIPISNMEDILSRDPSNPHRSFRFSSFQFPACKVCNDEFASLEGEVRPIVENIVKGNILRKEDIPKLLDWLDKVRVGLWLGNLQLDKNPHNITPRFAIKQRMGTSDRVLMIKRIEGFPDGINCIGTDTYAFAFSPSVFCLRINEYLLYSLSSVLFISKELGFPYYESAVFDYKSGGIKINLIEGTEKLSTPLSLIDIPKMSVILYQPLFHKQLAELHPELYDSDYIKNHCLNYSKGQGDIFIDNDGIRPMKSGEVIEFFSYDSAYPFFGEEAIITDVLNFQSWVTHNYHSKLDTKFLTEGENRILSQQYEKVISFNEKFRLRVSRLALRKALDLKRVISK
ncbi:hypothetical protein ABMA09_13995 [Erwinia rhapontici]|uniref:hypothetical protein n=1 Tax=Erwinia rhapontici TaxID=55212 RepID=UPI003D3659D9